MSPDLKDLFIEFRYPQTRICSRIAFKEQHILCEDISTRKRFKVLYADFLYCRQNRGQKMITYLVNGNQRFQVSGNGQPTKHGVRVYETPTGKLITK